MADEKASLEAPSSGRSEEKKSKLEQYEDSLRYKLWCLNLSQGLIDIFSSLVKTLPIALVVNVIALIITADERTIRLAGTIIFTVLLVVWLASLATFLWLMLRRPKMERHVEMGRKLVERHTNQTEDAFRDYKQTYVPPVGDEIFLGSMLDDNGRVGDHVRKRTWRSKWAISPEIQNDMTYWNGPLVDDIDKLDVDAGVFYNFLDFFSERCGPLLTKWAAQHKDTSGSRYISSAIAALYRYYVGDVQNENDTMSAQGRNLIDSDARTFLERYFFKGDPSNPSDISSLVLRADLELLAKEARKLQVEAITQRDRVLAKISYEYSGGR
jgi:hypothetical protein